MREDILGPVEVKSGSVLYGKSRTCVLERGLLLPLASISLEGELEPVDDELETAKLPLERLRAARPELKERPDLASG